MSEEVCHSAFARRNRDDTPRDMLVALIAREQHGVVRVAQLAACGLDGAAINRRMRSGRLHRIHRGVYAVGHDALTMLGSFVAAVLACGEGAALSHRAAAAYWGFWRCEERAPEVTVSGARRRIAGVRVYRARRLDRRDVRPRDGILVTSPARTLLDLAAVLAPQALKRAVRQAQADHDVNTRQLADVLSRANGHRGATRLRRLVADGPAPTRSPLEDVVYDLLVAAGIDRPEVNARLVLDERRIFPDLLWREQRLIVEDDSRRYHSGPLALADDAERQAILEAHGYRVLRVTWQQAVGRPQQTVARVRAAL
jgi:predicted transcriptional regulator of viral defense system